jgi:proteic killer suppression protein
MIKTYADKTTEQIANGETPRRVHKQVAQKALMRLVQIDNAVTLDDLKLPQSNCLEKLRGDREGQYSIRVNKQWRICFNFENGNATDVEFCDYH